MFPDNIENIEIEFQELYFIPKIKIFIVYYTNLKTKEPQLLFLALPKCT